MDASYSYLEEIHKIAGKYVKDNAPVLLHTGEMVADTKKVADILAEHFSKNNKRGTSFD